MFYILNLKVPDFHMLGVEMSWLMKTISYSPKFKKKNERYLEDMAFLMFIKTKQLKTNLDNLISRFALLFFSQNSYDIFTLNASNIFHLTLHDCHYLACMYRIIQRKK